MRNLGAGQDSVRSRAIGGALSGAPGACAGLGAADQGPPNSPRTPPFRSVFWLFCYVFAYFVTAGVLKLVVVGKSPLHRKF